MKLNFTTRSTRDEFTADTKEFFTENIFNRLDRLFLHYDIYIDYRGKQIAEVHGFTFDEEVENYHRYSFGDLADDLSGDAGVAIYTMLESDEFGVALSGSKDIKSYSSYIDKVYVDPKYRGKGVGKYIFTNLASILKYAFNIDLRCFTIIPKPQIFSDNRWSNDNDPDGEKRKIMIQAIEKAGYKQIEDSTEVWGINVQEALVKHGEQTDN